MTDRLVTRIGIVLGSTRPGRNGSAVAEWVPEVAGQRGGASFDLLDFDLPHLDEALPSSLGQYANEHSKRWVADVRAQVALSLMTDVRNPCEFTSDDYQVVALQDTDRPVIAWSKALAPLRPGGGHE